MKNDELLKLRVHQALESLIHATGGLLLSCSGRAHTGIVGGGPGGGS